MFVYRGNNDLKEQLYVPAVLAECTANGNLSSKQSCG